MTRIIVQIRSTIPPTKHTDDESEDGGEVENKERQERSVGFWRTKGMTAVSQARIQEMPELARGALVPATLTRHETVLTRMNRYLAWTGSVEDMACLTETALADLAANYLRVRQQDGKIKWSTVESEAGSLMGALRRRGRDIGKTPIMKDVMTSIKRNAAKQIIAWPMIFTPREVRTLITLAKGELQMFLILAFGGAMRPSYLVATSPTDTVVFKTVMGAPTWTIQELATHTSQGTTQRYLRYGAATAEAALAQKNTAMLELLERNDDVPEDFYFNYDGEPEEETDWPSLNETL